MEESKKKSIWTRILGGTLFVVIVFGLIWLRELIIMPFDIFAVLCGCVGAFETLNILKDDSKSSRVLIIILSASIIPTFYWNGEIGLLMLATLMFSVRAVIATFFEHNILKELSNFLFAMIYPVIIFALLIPMNHWGAYGTIALLLIFMIGPFSDVGAYLFGMTIGGKKLCPSISPNKTIAGAVGGVLGGIVGGITVYYISTAIGSTFTVPGLVSALENAGFAELEGRFMLFVVMGCIGAILTQIGDLVESAMKRNAGIKDSGKVLPGHGGILDRFDGTMFVTVMIYAIFATFII